MKRSILLFILFALAPLFVFAWGDDIKIQNAPGVNQGPGDIDVAFNGWMYAAYNADSGVVIRMSRDNGNTWNTIDSYRVSGTNYTPVHIAVAGTDTNNLRLFVASVNQQAAVPSYTVYVDVYDATTGVFLAENLNENFTTKIYNVDVAVDYRDPAIGASPYSVGVAYAKYTSVNDSIIARVSMDGGNTFPNRYPVASTGSFFRNVAISYGRSFSGSNGRYFVAWDRYSSSTAPMGNIYESRNTSTVNSSFITPVCLDSLLPAIIGYCSNPSISTSITAGDNDSGSLTAVVLCDKAYNGNPADHDIIGFYNKKAHYTNYWYTFSIDGSSNNTIEPSVAFDTVFKNFLVTYYDSTLHLLPYKVNGWNLAAPGTWATIRANYADDSVPLTHPFPSLAIDPAFNQAAFTWTKAGGPGTQYFDGEFRTVAPVITSLSPNSAHAGDPAFALLVNGYNFVNTSTVYWDATPLTTTFISGTQLSAPVTAPMIAAYGNVPVTVVTPPTLGGGTSNADTFHILFNLAVSNVPGSYNTVSLYPNPASNVINVGYSFTTENTLKVELYDMTGKMVRTLVPAGRVSGSNTVQTNVSDLAQGVYQVLIQNGDKISTDKIVISH
ncbi:MAG: T9SS type A sorting domain-containing protein [Bacteroidetes bacterium]|nr:T9SS type A sorting domain-containing protein [Bacteroidota bacterium]